MQVCWTSDSSSIISASIDKTVAIWDLEVRSKILEIDWMQ